ncbi:hypothetical protein ACWED2_17185 [Amycolatopsis sp. NPDC005003]
MARRVLAGGALLVVAMAGPAAEGAAGPVPRTRHVGRHPAHGDHHLAAGFDIGAHERRWP